MTVTILDDGRYLQKFAYEHQPSKQYCKRVNDYMTAYSWKCGLDVVLEVETGTCVIRFAIPHIMGEEDLHAMLHRIEKHNPVIFNNHTPVWHFYSYGIPIMAEPFDPIIR